MSASSASPGRQAQDAPLQLSVVMATYNRRKLLPRTIESIINQDLNPNCFELVIVVDGSTDGTTEYLKSLRTEFAIRIIEQHNQGLSVALNRGISSSRGDIVLLVDDDLVLHPSNLRIHVEAHSSNEPLVVHGPVYVARESVDSVATDWIREGVNEEIRRWEGGWTWPDDANIDPNYSAPRVALLDSGGYDENFKWRQNCEFGVRLVKMGLRIVYEPKAIAHHVYSKTTQEFLDVQVRSWGAEEILLLQKHPELRPYSPLALVGSSSIWKRFSIQFAARSPVSPDVLLRMVSASLDWSRFSPLARRIGLNILRKRISITFFRSATAAVGWENLQRDFGVRLPVLMYHHIGSSPPNSDRDLNVPAEKFDAQVRFLAKRGFVGIRPSDWLEWVRYGKPLPKKPMLLSFDDAFKDLEDHAFPVLKKHGFGGIVFVVTSCVGKANLWDEERGFDLRPCLSLEQIQLWSSRGIDFGAHSRTHPDLTKVSESALFDELIGSRRELEEIVQHPVFTFAYPYGHYDARAAECAARVFDLSFTTDDGLSTLKTDASLLHRNMVYAWDSPLDLEFLVRLGWNPVRSLNLSLRKRFRFLKVVWRNVFRKSK